MDKISLVNIERIAWCCQDFGITLEQLAQQCGVSQSTMDRAQQNKVAFSFAQLQKIAHYFGRGVLFFLEPEPVNAERVHSPQFRTLANQKPELNPTIKKIIQRAERHRDIYLALKEDLDAEDFPQFHPPDIPPNNPAKAARIARQWLDSKVAKPQNNFEAYRSAVEARGILVFRSMGYNGAWQFPKDSKISGFNLYDQHCPVIVIKKESEARQTFTLMHELGHILMHQQSFIDDDDSLKPQHSQQHEREANQFAGKLLVPTDFVEQLPRLNNVDVQEFDAVLHDFNKRWGVSTEVLVVSLIDAKHLRQSAYEEYKAWKDSAYQKKQEVQTGKPKTTIPRKYREREPIRIFGDGYVRTVLTALHDKQITLNKATSYLDGIKVSDLHKLEGYYARRV